MKTIAVSIMFVAAVAASELARDTIGVQYFNEYLLFRNITVLRRALHGSGGRQASLNVI